MVSCLLYIGPGIGMGTIVLVFIVLLIVIASVVMIIWTPIKYLVKRILSILRR